MQQSILLIEDEESLARFVELELQHEGYAVAKRFDGLECLPAGLEILAAGETSECLVTLREGKFHQVKRMLAARGKPVEYLKRLSMGSLRLDDTLAPGEFRLLTAAEEAQLQR